nr:unnamed protein product [Callosobruchus chinensis]
MKPPLFLSNLPLKYVDNIKFLGITFDERLTWKQHIRGLVHSCQKALNILKCLANKHWGSDGKTLLSLYRSLIRSKIDYGCIAYASASPSTLKQLDTLHNSALRLILGAFRTTPVDSLYCESGEAPLHSRRQILSLAYAAKVKSNPRHPVYKKISPSRSTTFNCKLYRKPFHVRIQQYLQEINVSDFPSPLPNTSSETAPWIIKPPTINTNMIDISKHVLPTSTVIKHFYDILSTYSDYAKIYTDAAKFSANTGAAVVTPTCDVPLKLPDETTVLTGELYAIWEALRYIAQEPALNWLIITDSLNSLLLIKKLYCKNPLVNLIKEQMAFLSTRKVIALLWVPSHSGIEGNEKADSLAKQAANSSNPSLLKVPASDIKVSIREKVIAHWNNEWLNKASKLRELKSSLSPWQTVTASRKHQVIVTRLRLGHTRLTHGYLFDGTSAPTCEICEVPQTVEHILVTCPMLEVYKHSFKIDADIKNILGPRCNVKNLISFLSSTQLLHKL